MVMDWIVETIRRTATDQKRSCGYVPYIEILINSKVGKNVYLLDNQYLPINLEFEDNVVVMDPSHPTLATAEADAQEEATRASSAPVLRSKGDEMPFLISTI
ncbi:nucleolin [Hordeum vulgare]|nr:nucleolin [Hordeum vulgare]